ncbi:MAG: response regulator transcription factor [Planctomycetota bacterium]
MTHASSQLPRTIPTRVRIGLVLSHDVIRFGLEHAWSTSSTLKVVSADDTWDHASQLRLADRVDVVICNTSNESSSVQTICRSAQSMANVRVIVLASAFDPLTCEHLRQQGVSAYLSQASRIHRLEAAIDWVMTGQFVADSANAFGVNPIRVDPAAGDRVRINSPGLRPEPPTSSHRSSGQSSYDIPTPTHSSSLRQLSKREREVLDGLVSGKTNQQVADELFLSVKTIETYRLRIRKKLGVKDRAGMVALMKGNQPQHTSITTVS